MSITNHFPSKSGATLDLQVPLYDGAGSDPADYGRYALSDLKNVIVMLGALGVYVGSTEPTYVTYAQWLATKSGYWAWLEIPEA